MNKFLFGLAWGVVLTLCLQAAHGIEPFLRMPDKSYVVACYWKAVQGRWSSNMTPEEVKQNNPGPAWVCVSFGDALWMAAHNIRITEG